MTDRRTTLKWLVTALALPSVSRRGPVAEEAPGLLASEGYSIDPDLTRRYHPGGLWPLTLTLPQRRLATVLSDLIIPADDESPSASSVGVVDFLDEWISAPYPLHTRDRETMVRGLAWMEAEARSRFGRAFCDIQDLQQRAICDDICFEPRAKPSVAAAAQFFSRMRDLVAGAFYCTAEGRRDLKYMGNTPLARFEGPPLEVLRRVGLA